MTAQRRLTTLLGHLTGSPPATQTPAQATPPADSSPVHHFQQDLESGHAQQGVLAYGLEDHDGHGRQMLRRTWQPPIDAPASTTHPFSKSTDSSPALDTKGLTTVDRFNNLTWREFPKRLTMGGGPFGEREQSLDNQQLHASLTQFRKAESSAAGLTPAEKAQAKSFQRGLLAHPRYSIFRTRADDVHALMKKEAQDTPEKAMFRSQTIRACKFGIEYGQLEGRQVMFELGGMQTADAAGKSQVGRLSSATGKQVRSITNAELRKAFRHDVSDQSLQFYRDGQRADAPWAKKDQEGAAWGQYMDKRMAKYQKLGFKPDLEKAAKAHASGPRSGFRELNAQISAFKNTLPKPAQVKSPAKIISKL
jgi:hypothetical protein